MSDLSAESKAEVDRLAQPVSNEAEILNDNVVREEALKDKAKVVKEDKPEEVKLPKLSAADERVYNSMAEHMEYVVVNPDEGPRGHDH